MFGSSPVWPSIRAPERRLQAGYNDVKVRRGGGTRRLSDRDAGSLRRAGVKCHALSGSNAAGIGEITGNLASLLFSLFLNSALLSFHIVSFAIVSFHFLFSSFLSNPLILYFPFLLSFPFISSLSLHNIIYSDE